MQCEHDRVKVGITEDYCGDCGNMLPELINPCVEITDYYWVAIVNNRKQDGATNDTHKQVVETKKHATSESPEQPEEEDFYPDPDFQV